MTWKRRLQNWPELLQHTYRLLPPLQRRRAFGLGLLIVLVSLLDVLSVASIVPLLWLVFGHAGDSLHLGGLPVGLLLPLALGAWVLLFFIKNALGWWTSLLQNRFAYRLASLLSGQQFDRLFQANRRSGPADHSAEALRRVHHVPVEFAAHVLLALVHLAAEGLIFLGLVAGLAVYQWQMFLLLMLLIVPLALLFYRQQRYRLKRLGASLHRLAGEAIRRLMDALSSWPEIHLYHRQEAFRQAYLKQQERLNHCVAVFHSLNSLPPRFLEMVVVLAVAILVLAAHLLGFEAEKMVLLLGLFTAAAYRLMPSLNRISSAFLQLQTYRHTVALLTPPPAATAQGSVQPQPVPFRRSFALEGVSFAYPDRGDFALRGLSVRVKRGETVGICGPSGSGKTTLLLLIMGLLEPRQGRLLVDGRPLTPAHLPGWQQQIGYVPQQVVLLDGTVLENIVFEPGVAPAAVDRAALDYAVQAAGLKEWVQSLPRGLETPVGEHGGALSGGQRQRIVLARALYRQPALLVLDEATSELDPATEQDILSALKSLQETHLTLIIVSHRQAPLALCHRCYELANGRLRAIRPEAAAWRP